MEVSATTKYIRISPIKARGIAARLRGLSVAEALRVTAFNPGKAAAELGKTLRSAAANARNNNKIPEDALVVKDAVVNQGPVLKRFRPRARGSASGIRKPTAHITVVLTDRK